MPWSKAVIIPLHKKGNTNDPGNYRGISITSSLGKLFTSILNRRLMEWNLTENVITDAQYGFQLGRSTIDAIFALQSLISQKLNNKQRLYCCFIDYQKAFDTVNREK